MAVAMITSLAPVAQAAGKGHLRLRFSRVADLLDSYSVVSGTGGEAHTYVVSGMVVSDDERYAVFPSAQGQVEIYDAKLNRLSPPIAIDPRCAPVVADKGRAVIACTPLNTTIPVPSPSVLNLRTHALQVVPRFGSGSFLGDDHPVAVGRYWIAFDSCPFARTDECVRLYVNWRTGASPSEVNDRRDLDSLRLAPARRSPRHTSFI